MGWLCVPTPRVLGVSCALILSCAGARPLHADPVVSRLTPPSNRFREGRRDLPVVARFAAGQRFDMQATISPDLGQTIEGAEFFVDGTKVERPVTLSSPTVPGFAPGTRIATLRAYSESRPGLHELGLRARQSDDKITTVTGDFEVVAVAGEASRAKQIIFIIGDGMGIAHRTAARLMLHGASQGRMNGLLAMDRMPFTGMVMTCSLDSVITDSSPGACCYSSGNKARNGQHGVFPDDTFDVFDNPRVELIAEYLARTRGISLGLVTTSDVADSTPAAWATHTQSRGAGTGICDQYLDHARFTGLRVLMGGGRRWFVPRGKPESARTAERDCLLPDDLAAEWALPSGALDPERDLLNDFQAAGWTYVADKTALAAATDVEQLLGLFAWSNLNVALDKIGGRRGTSAVVNDYGLPDQPMLDEMTRKALEVLAKDEDGFLLMVEGASIDKQAHKMDSDRWIVDTIELDRAVAVCLRFAEEHPGTLVVVTADHECGGALVVGTSTLTDAELAARAAAGAGVAQLRDGVVAESERGGFPRYVIAPDGYPVTTDVDHRLIVGYAAGADRYEDWRTNPLPLREMAHPAPEGSPLLGHPATPLEQDRAGGFLVTGETSGTYAAHTASDVPVSAYGRGAPLFLGVMDNTDVFFHLMRAALGGAPAGRSE